MSFIYYLLEVNLYIVLSYGLYKLVYQKETFYQHNRFYLLFSSLIAFLIPIIQIGWLSAKQLDNIEGGVVQTNIQNSSLNVAAIILIVYMVTAAVFFTKLYMNISKLLTHSKKAKYMPNQNFKVVIIENDKIAYSFLNTLFIHPQLLSEPSVIQHEEVHIRQRHSWDILYFELLQIICWFNPVIYFMKKDLKLVHEYLADEKCTHNSDEKHAYAMFLIQNSFYVHHAQLKNQIFNQSLLKNRILMLHKKRTTGLTKFRILLSLPLVFVMLLSSSAAFSKSYALIEIFPAKGSIIQDDKKQDPKSKKAANSTNKQVPPPPVDPNQSKQVKKDQVKFPPPIVKQDKKADDSKFPPPPPVDPNQPKQVKKDQVKFPPPIVKQDKKGDDSKFPPPPPVDPNQPKQVKKDQVKFPPPIVKQDKKPNN